MYMCMYMYICIYVHMYIYNLCISYIYIHMYVLNAELNIINAMCCNMSLCFSSVIQYPPATEHVAKRYHTQYASFNDNRNSMYVCTKMKYRDVCLLLAVRLSQTLFHKFSQLLLLHRSSYSFLVVDLFVDCEGERRQRTRYARLTRL